MANKGKNGHGKNYQAYCMSSPDTHGWSRLLLIDKRRNHPWVSDDGCMYSRERIIDRISKLYKLCYLLNKAQILVVVWKR